MQTLLENHPYIQEIKVLENKFFDRREFHKNVQPVLIKMGNDNDFLKLVIKRNFSDKGYLTHTWSKYNIPFFYVYETDYFILKIHLFPTIENYRNDIAAHCIHHHNNYLLSTNAFFGSGYESMLFSKNPKVDETTKEVKMKVTKHFHQNDWNPSFVDSWEPHVVFAPKSLSATILMWSPDEKKVTDNLRNNPILKSIKTPLRFIISKLGLNKNFGIAAEKTYQFYPNPSGNNFKGIEENEYFAPSRAEKGLHIDDYSMQMIFSFLQRANLIDEDLLRQMKLDANVPKYYRKWIDKVLVGEAINEVFHPIEINIPQKIYYREDIIKAIE
jgi:hypothetical protein